MSAPNGTAGQWTPPDFASEYQSLVFVISQLIARQATAAWVQVLSCSNNGAAAAVGTVTVQPLVNQLTGAGQPVPHAPIYQMPYARLQGGTSAVIIDPVAGDIGLALFASRDSSAVRNAALGAGLPGGQTFNPGSNRSYDWGDGMYLGGMLNGVPGQWVRFSAAGVEVVSPTAITFQAPNITLTGAVNANGAKISTAGEVTDAAGKVLGTHVHTGVTSGGSDTGPPA